MKARFYLTYVDVREIQLLKAPSHDSLIKEDGILGLSEAISRDAEFSQVVEMSQILLHRHVVHMSNVARSIEGLHLISL